MTGMTIWYTDAARTPINWATAVVSGKATTRIVRLTRSSNDISETASLWATPGRPVAASAVAKAIAETTPGPVPGPILPTYPEYPAEPGSGTPSVGSVTAAMLANNITLAKFGDSPQRLALTPAERTILEAIDLNDDGELDVDSVTNLPEALTALNTAVGRVRMLDVRAFGAATTGSAAANAAAIQAAVDAAAAAGGGQVFIPAGTWTTDPLVMKTRVSLHGSGWGTVLMLAAGANTHMVTLADKDTEQVGFADLTLNGNGANQTAGDVVHIDNTGFDTARAWPSTGDPNHYMARVMIRGAKVDGLSVTGDACQSNFRQVFAYDCDRRGIHIAAPDSHFTNCVAARSGEQGFYLAATSNRLVNCKALLSGRLVAANGVGFAVQAVNRNEIFGCESRDNRSHGFSLTGCANTRVLGIADRNGLGADANGGVGDGIYLIQVRDSVIDLICSDRNVGGLKQRWAYNSGGQNAGNQINLTAGSTSTGAVGSGDLGQYVGGITFNGAIVPGPTPPLQTSAKTAAAYTLGLVDAGTQVTASNAAGFTLTVPPNSGAAIPVGSIIMVTQTGTGQITFAPGSGVTINSLGGALKTSGQHAVAFLYKVSLNVWRLYGGIAA